LPNRDPWKAREASYWTRFLKRANAEDPELPLEERLKLALQYKRDFHVQIGRLAAERAAARRTAKELEDAPRLMKERAARG
jgi:hypothetical protein